MITQFLPSLRDYQKTILQQHRCIHARPLRLTCKIHKPYQPQVCYLVAVNLDGVVALFKAVGFTKPTSVTDVLAYVRFLPYLG